MRGGKEPRSVRHRSQVRPTTPPVGPFVRGREDRRGGGGPCWRHRTPPPPVPPPPEPVPWWSRPGVMLALALANLGVAVLLVARGQGFLALYAVGAGAAGLAHYLAVTSRGR